MVVLLHFYVSVVVLCLSVIILFLCEVVLCIYDLCFIHFKRANLHDNTDTD